MDKATIGGLISVSVLLLAAILMGGPLSAFINAPSIAIVVGGTTGALFIACPTSDVLAAAKAGKFAFMPQVYLLDETVKMLSELSGRARSEGLLSMETVAEETEDAFLKRGLRLLADGHDPDTVESILYGEIGKVDERHKSAIAIWDALGAYGPAMGMIGTLIGLVQMLQAMSDPTAIGPAMAVALLTTLYGSLIANVIGIPIANKLKIRNGEEIAQKELIVEGLLSILAGENPRMLVERLNATLSPTARVEEAA